MRSMLRHWHVSLEQLPSEDRREWRIIIEFLRRTDPPLLSRISRRMINYMVWNGVEEAQSLLERLGTDQRSHDATDENRPLERASLDELTRATNAAFRIAADNLTEDEIVHVI